MPDQKSPIAESESYENCLNKKQPTQTLNDFFPEDDKIIDPIPPTETDASWKTHWKGMPEFDQQANPPYKQLLVNFRTEEDYQAFAKLIDQTLTVKTRSIWHPKLVKQDMWVLRWVTDES